jgi:hypothetical protein
MNNVEGILNKTIRSNPNSSENLLTVRFGIYPLKQHFLKSNYSLLFNHLYTISSKLQILRSLKFVSTSLLFCPFPVKKQKTPAIRQHVNRKMSGRIWLYVHIKRISIFFCTATFQTVGRVVSRCLDHTQFDIPGRTPLNKRRSSSHRPQPTQHKTNTTDEHTWPQRGFETAIPTIEQLQTYALDRTLLA